MFYTPQSAAQFGKSPELKQKMALVRQFCFEHGLLGAKTSSVDDVAIDIPTAQCKARPIAYGSNSIPPTCNLAAQGKL